jgi:cellulose synthase/poly-beta-1,6-N-acetylglucosamine synthase-like glycosyltransferase
MPAFQILATWAYLAVLRSAKSNPSVETDLYQPKAAILLSLRGPDPFLGDCVTALLNQAYPEYELQIIVDSATDPAWEIVQRAIAQSSSTVPVSVRPLEQRRSTCSLKCSALIEAVEALDASVEVIAFVDADTLAHPQWLQQLVAPLGDDNVGITTGNRWYTPVGDQLGTLNRYAWNAFAVIATYFSKLPWGGTMALKADLLRQADPLKLWGNALCEDVPLRQVAIDRQLEVRFVPSLLSVNREECDLPSFIRWSTRQLVLTRLYHPTWWFTLANGLWACSGPIANLSLAAIALLTHHRLAAGIFLLNFAIIFLGSIILPLLVLEKGIQAAIATPSAPLPMMTRDRLPKLLISLAISPFISLYTLLAAAWARSIQWRGITYEIQSNQQAHMVEYRPYRSGHFANPNILTQKSL